MKKLVKLSLFFLIFSILPLSCAGNDNLDSKNTPKVEITPEIKTLTLTFAGDIMAHDTNFYMKDYSKIYEDLAEILLEDDLSFGNMEMPICDSLPMSNYPNFNVHSSYLKAAIEGGFEVLALANNHTNDQGTKGIDGTLKSISLMEENYNADSKNVWFSGLKATTEEEITPITIEKNGFKVGFLSVTELLNSYDASKKRLYYSEPNTKGREKLVKLISEYREKEELDLFILTLHLNEAEYGLTVANSKVAWFKKLNEAGVDIICASHPHVMQTWEVVRPKTELSGSEKVAETTDTVAKTEPTQEKEPRLEPFFMYSMGNFISAQRVTPNYANPKHYREYTGDAVLLQVKLTKSNGSLLPSYEVKPFPITVYKSSDGLVLRRFTEEWIESLPSERDRKYYSTRLEYLKEYLPL